MSDKIFLCEGVGKEGQLCPIREQCAFFCEGFDKTKTFHWAFAPYNFRLGRCDEFEQVDNDWFNELNIVS